MKTLEQKRCLNCGENFLCGSEIGEDKCWCEQLPHVSLPENKDQECFCPPCLSEAIQKLDYATSSTGAGATKSDAKAGSLLIEGEDYYLEGAAIVFTAGYHIRRGYCCESGCRHCPYGREG